MTKNTSQRYVSSGLAVRRQRDDVGWAIFLGHFG